MPGRLESAEGNGRPAVRCHFTNNEVDAQVDKRDAEKPFWWGWEGGLRNRQKSVLSAVFLTKNERGALFGPRWRCRFHVGAGAERPRVLPQAASSPESAPPHRAAARALPGPGRAPSCHQRSCFLFVLLLCCFLAVTPEPALLCASTLGLALFPVLSRASKSVSVSVSTPRFLRICPGPDAFAAKPSG